MIILALRRYSGYGVQLMLPAAEQLVVQEQVLEQQGGEVSLLLAQSCVRWRVAVTERRNSDEVVVEVVGVVESEIESIVQTLEESNVGVGRADDLPGAVRAIP